MNRMTQLDHAARPLSRRQIREAAARAFATRNRLVAEGRLPSDREEGATALTQVEAILAALVDGEPASNETIAMRSGVPLRIVQTRIGELRAERRVVRCGRTRPVFHQLPPAPVETVRTTPNSVFALGTIAMGVSL